MTEEFRLDLLARWAELLGARKYSPSWRDRAIASQRLGIVQIRAVRYLIA